MNENSAITDTDIMTTYKTVNVNGVGIFYREASPKDAPVVLLLHGYSSSSRMFEPLLATPHLISNISKPRNT